MSLERSFLRYRNRLEKVFGKRNGDRNWKRKIPIRQNKVLFEPLEPRILLSTVTWDGGGDGTSWGDARNWDNDILPTVSDDVFISTAGPVITHSQNVDTINSLHSIRTLTLSGGSLSIAATSEITGGLNLTNATLTGAGEVTLGGSSTWTGGTMSATGKTVIAPGATIDLSGAGTKTADGRTLENLGTVIWQGGSLYGTNGAAIVNRAGALFDDQNPSSHSLSTYVTGSRPQLTIDAGSVFRKTGAGDAHLYDVIFANAGTVEVDQGTLALTQVYGGGSGTHSGTFDIHSGAVLNFGAFTQTLNAGTLFLGDGTVQVTGGTLNLGADLSIPNPIILSSGTLAGSGDLTVQDTLTWTGGTMSGRAQR